MSTDKQASIISILPLLIFVGIFLWSGIYFNNFYSIPSPLIALAGVVVALLIYKSTLKEKIQIFFTGAGNSNVLAMCVISLLAGGFSFVTKASGSVDSIVNLGTYYISPAYLPLGVFLVSSFLSFATGTSVGTIMTLGTIVIDLATQSQSNISLVGACLLSGAMFGDNLSLISDTTITSTQTMGAEMSDKMKANSKIAIPAAILTMIILIFIGNSDVQPAVSKATADFDVVLILPYIAVVVLSLLGVNVFASLFTGIIFAGTLGIIYGKFDFLGFTTNVYEGFMSMSEVFLLFFFTGGLATLVEYFGGIRFLMNGIQKYIKSYKTALLGIGALVSSANLCVANNTVSILIVSKISRKISTKFNIAPRNGASVLDIFSCYVQGIIPYGAQVLGLIYLSKNTINYPELVLYAVYLHLLLLLTLGYIIFRSKKTLLEK
ncbi:Na+/H+ antiporter NhaC family protein [Capnocytophaga canis]|uniref:Na+/H+ antiporter NhaC family protein n=1 Tax=Capnocytophaga canis TaxID=1848903 RepID=UPI0015620C8E|nr:Na+/H+ antiporter NhaC family protein [Capnocytophaga canis]